MDKILLNIIGITYSKTQSGAYVLILGENNGKRRLPIVIGSFEAQAIAIELENMKPTRPLTHDLFLTLASEFDISISEIVIYQFVEGIFYSKIYCIKENNTVEIDSRTSDAVALAVRFKCPVYTVENVINEAGIVFEDPESETETEESTEDTPKSEFVDLSDEELEDMLNEAVRDEDYEKASRIRDEINKRNNIT